MRLRSQKGFTLIEILAVVIILAIAIGIAVPAYNSYIYSSQQRLFETAEKSLIKSATAVMLECARNRGDKICKGKYFPEKENEYTILYLKELIENGDIDPIHNPKHRDKYCDEENSYAYVLKNTNVDGGDYTYHACLRCDGYESKACNNKVLNQK